MEVNINMNDRVRVELTERGAQIAEEHALSGECCRSERLYEGSFWEMMYMFGQHCYMGPEPPFMKIPVIDDTFALKMSIEDSKLRSKHITVER